MPDLTLRSYEPEKMDQPGVAEKEIHQALRELEIINKRLGGYHVILNALNAIRWPDRVVTIMDLGCGGGDMLRAIARWAEKKKRKVKLIGVDWNPVMTTYAAERSGEFQNISYKTVSVFDDTLPDEKADVTMNSLFCHHFDNDELILLMKRMYALAALGVIVNDIHRHWFAYHSIKMITLLFSRTYLVKYDGPLSVARSLKRKEWEDILSAARITNYKLRWMWAWRWQIIVEKNRA
ncbi:MAG: methyltransferase domain-containing protein [Chitinophagales bacterium]|nr:methyltransferase domain-containing protein [Chitinophagales bacterium]